MGRIPRNLVVITFGLISFANLAFADASTPDKFTVTPVNPNAVDTSALIYELKPGDQTTDEINIKNFSSEKKDFVLYVTDGYITKDGAKAYRNEDETSQLAGLAKPEFRTVTIGPEETKTVKILINIPANQTLGDYNGGIAVVSTKPDKNMPTLNIALRYMMRLNIKVTNTPTHIPLLSESEANIVYGPTPYLVTSVAVFLFSIGYFIWASRKEKNSSNTK